MDFFPTDCYPHIFPPFHGQFDWNRCFSIIIIFNDVLFQFGRSLLIIAIFDVWNKIAKLSYDPLRLRILFHFLEINKI